MATPWSGHVDLDHPWPEYPRPQMVRPNWQNLNGRWQLAIGDHRSWPPDTFDEEIIIPYPLESELGGVTRTLLPMHTAWYCREFAIEPNLKGERYLLHFGAVDWQAKVWLNDHLLGEHRGGFDSFDFDITKHLDKSGPNRLVVMVRDPTEEGTQPVGKQAHDGNKIRYSPVSGIWQTVWIEAVPQSYISRVVTTPLLDASSVEVKVEAKSARRGDEVRLQVLADGEVVGQANGTANIGQTIELATVRKWSPDDPFLYDLHVSLVRDGKVVDEVTSYFGMRSIALGRDINQQVRMMLNGEPVFQIGVLEQGYWPDGLYTPPCDEAIQHELRLVKQMGFNLIRKHMKVEPARWYYWCDKMGLLVWQDMPSGDKPAGWPHAGRQINRTEESAAQYRHELAAMISGLRSHPCIVTWVAFNEGWGQFDTKGITDYIRELDPTRLIISATGGNDLACGDINSNHDYSHINPPPAEPHRAAAIGEFGGLGIRIRGHGWQDSPGWGYRMLRTKDDWLLQYRVFIEDLRAAKRTHLSAAVYTQLTDVQQEQNGLQTYDREVVKVDVDEVASLNRLLSEPIPAQSPQQLSRSSALAWWRFEDGTPGVRLSDITLRMGAVAAEDSSDNGNHVYAHTPALAPATSDAAPSRPLLGGTVTNRYCLDDGDTLASASGGQYLRTVTKLRVARTDIAEQYPFNEWTIEVSVRPRSVDSEQTILGKRRFNLTYLANELLLGLDIAQPDGTLRLTFFDESNVQIQVPTDYKLRPGVWQHLAATCDGHTVKLYVAQDDPDTKYQLVGRGEVNGGLSRVHGHWFIGRAQLMSAEEKDYRGLIDEVRICAKCLKPDELLFSN